MDNQPIQSTPPTPSSGNPSKTLLLILGAIALMAISAFGGYFLGANKQSPYSQTPNQPFQTSPTTTSPNSPTATPTPVSDETAGWKTYTSQKHGYSVNYPPLLKYESRYYESFNGRCRSFSDEWKDENYHISVDINEVGVCTGLEFNLRPKPEETISIAGQKVKKLASEDETLIHIGPLTNGKNNYMLIYTSGIKPNVNGTKIFNQILSTFQFSQ